LPTKEWRGCPGKAFAAFDAVWNLIFGRGVKTLGGWDQSLYLANKHGDSHNNFRLDGNANTLYIIGRSDSGAKAGVGITFRTAPAGGAELNRVTIDPNGKVGLGRTPSKNRLEVEGGASKTTAGSWLANSDMRIKTDIHDLEDALGVIERLHPVWFRYSRDYMSKHPSIGEHEYCNFIAQEYRQVFPDSVKEDGEGLLQMDDHNVTPYLVAAVQHLIQENRELRARLETLEQSAKPTIAS
jgi:hypothetical protein